MSIGYENATIIKIITLLVLILTLSFSSSYISLSFNINKIIHGEIYRLITSHLVFSSMASAFVGLLLLYSCRHFERYNHHYNYHYEYYLLHYPYHYSHQSL